MLYDLVIIGGGPGGYTGAIRAAQLGLKVAVVEKDTTLGGTCLNVGCIPSKALLDSSEHYYFAKEEISHHGVRCSSVSLDLQALMKRKYRIVGELTRGIEYLFRKNKIEWLKGEGCLLSPHEVQVKGQAGDRKTFEARHIMLATGSVPNELSGVKWDGEQILSSTEALSLNKVPEKLLVIGGGYIGLEMGSVWSRLGAEVVVLEYADRLCPSLDKQLSGALLKSLKKQGISFLMNTKVLKATPHKSGVQLLYQDSEGKEQTLNGEKILLAVGRQPYTQGLGLDSLNIKKDERGFVPVDSNFRVRGHSHIFAIGDLIGGVMLAHKAEEEGVAVVETVAGGAGHVHYETLPSVIYTWPEVASVGKTEEELKHSGVAYRVGQFPFSANGRAKALGCTEGFVKILAHEQSDRILGVHIMGPKASDMIAEAVMAMEFEGRSEDVALSFHAHPTLSEVMREAALNVKGRARQI